MKWDEGLTKTFEATLECKPDGLLSMNMKIVINSKTCQSLWLEQRNIFVTAILHIKPVNKNVWKRQWTNHYFLFCRETHNVLFKIHAIRKTLYHDLQNKLVRVCNRHIQNKLVRVCNRHIPNSKKAYIRRGIY